MFKKGIKWFFGISLFILCFSIFRPVPILPESQLLSTTGEVIKVRGGGENDIVFIIKDSKTRYYINRGTEQGLVIEDLHDRMVGKEITIKYPHHWTPLDPKNKVKHLSKLYFDDEVIFSEVEGL